jgi:hypothetical protein
VLSIPHHRSSRIAPWIRLPCRFSSAPYRPATSLFARSSNPTFLRLDLCAAMLSVDAVQSFVLVILLAVGCRMPLTECVHRLERNRYADYLLVILLSDFKDTCLPIIPHCHLIKPVHFICRNLKHSNALYRFIQKQMRPRNIMFAICIYYLIYGLASICRINLNANFVLATWWLMSRCSPCSIVS